jgi:hypothetical protein
LALTHKTLNYNCAPDRKQAARQLANNFNTILNCPFPNHLANLWNGLENFANVAVLPRRCGKKQQFAAFPHL